MTHKYYKIPNKIKSLSEIQRNVTQNNSTERSFTGVYDKHFEEGLYVDIVSGEPLFTSLDKFDSGCGWPAFSNAIKDNINEVHDVSHGIIRIEVRSIHGDSHLGHVFTDGPQNKGGLRYCINSAALRFIPKTDLEREGYKKYLKLFNTGGKHED